MVDFVLGHSSDAIKNWVYLFITKNLFPTALVVLMLATAGILIVFFPPADVYLKTDVTIIQLDTEALV